MEQQHCQMPEAVITRQANLVYRLAYAKTHSVSDAEDVFQEVFLRYVKKAPQFDSLDHEKAWFIRVTSNCTKKLWTSAWAKKVLPLEEDVPMEIVEEQELLTQLNQLPAKYREVLYLFYYEDYNVEEIAGLLGRKNATIRSQLTRARQKLKGYLEEEAYAAERI